MADDTPSKPAKPAAKRTRGTSTRGSSRAPSRSRRGKAKDATEVPSWAKLTPEVIESLVRLIGAGNFYTVAARACGISEATFHRWMKRGEEHLALEEQAIEAAERGEDATFPEASLYRDLFDRVTKARGEAEARAVTLVSIASETDWKAATWWLSKVNPEWREDRRVELAGDPDAPLHVDATVEVDLEKPVFTQSQRMAGTIRALVEAGKLPEAMLEITRPVAVEDDDLEDDEEPEEKIPGEG